MDVQVAPLEDTSAVATLLDWLLREEELRGLVQRSKVAPQPGHMGGLTEFVTVAVGSGGALTVLLSSISGWLRSRRSDVTVEVTIGKNKVRVDAKRLKADPDALAKIIAEASQALDEN
ncbi:hypothetical protein [Lentzea sp. NPDC003310]|uniref:effector-associated constant component EACC1 n=1 Tax=Lentzea sp. NPDC003310 TaxID=3154447 RepID=UPI0033B44177